MSTRTAAGRPATLLALTVLVGAVPAACSSSASGSTAAAVTADRCIVRLHGKGELGAPTVLVRGIGDVAPTGNADGWGGRQWVYSPEDRYLEALAVVTASIDTTGCRRVVLDGFSNGGAFAASVACHGETFGGRLAGVVVDDPVTDAATDGCRRGAGVRVELYWTGALAQQAPAGTGCAGIDWTCAGGVVVGIDEFASRLGVAVTRSPNTTHRWYRDAPELTAWLPAS